MARTLQANSILPHLHGDEMQLARVNAEQQLLFPANPRALCQDMGLNWWAATKLYEDGWLSFSPTTTPKLDEAQEAELRFIGSLVIAGCDRNMLAVLLGALSKPYSYDVKRLYYDWFTRSWRLLPEPQGNPESLFTDWLENLVQSGDIGTLTGIGELAHDALSRVHREPGPTTLRQGA